MSNVSRINPFGPYVKEPRAYQEQKPLVDICRHKIAQISHQVLVSINETQLAKSAYDRKHTILGCKELSIILASGCAISIATCGLLISFLNDISKEGTFLSASKVCYK